MPSFGPDDWSSIAGSTIAELKKAAGTLPEGDQRNHIAELITRAETLLGTAQAEQAKALGYKLCHCKMPPPVMLWDKDRGVNVCPSCGDTNPRPVDVRSQPDYEPDWIKVRR